MEISALFDSYSRKARVAPALFALLPPVLSVALWAPTAYGHLVGLLSLLVAGGSLIVLANMARYLGRKAQLRLYKTWGGQPTTMMLRHADGTVDSVTKQRYHEFLQNRVPGLQLPSAADERSDGHAADVSYSSACKWLLEHTRDRNRFGLLFKENTEYGFRRNLRGLTPIGITLALTSAVGGAFGLFVTTEAGLNESGVIATLLSLIALAIWVFVITDDWVRDSADSYAVRLLACCDAI